MPIVNALSRGTILQQVDSVNRYKISSIWESMNVPKDPPNIVNTRFKAKVLGEGGKQYSIFQHNEDDTLQYIVDESVKPSIYATLVDVDSSFPDNLKTFTYVPTGTLYHRVADWKTTGQPPWGPRPGTKIWDSRCVEDNDIWVQMFEESAMPGKFFAQMIGYSGAWTMMELMPPISEIETDDVVTTPMDTEIGELPASHYKHHLAVKNIILGTTNRHTANGYKSTLLLDPSDFNAEAICGCIYILGVSENDNTQLRPIPNKQELPSYTNCSDEEKRLMQIFGRYAVSGGGCRCGHVEVVTYSDLVSYIVSFRMQDIDAVKNTIDEIAAFVKGKRDMNEKDYLSILDPLVLDLLEFQLQSHYKTSTKKVNLCASTY